MKIEAGKFYILGNGQLAKMLLGNGAGGMIGAMYEADYSVPCWDAYLWQMDGRFGTGPRPRSSLDILELINSRASQVSYAREHDYCATYDNDEPDDGNMRQGFGATELEAVMDLLQAYPGEERAEMMRDDRHAAHPQQEPPHASHE
jgi:hypothetical protein